jgi:hypothetical protein
LLRSLHLASFWLAPLAAMFAGDPPSSSNPTNGCLANLLYSDAFRRLLLQIGGANIAPRGSRLEAAVFLTRSQPAVVCGVPDLSALAARLLVQTATRDLWR